MEEERLPDPIKAEETDRGKPGEKTEAGKKEKVPNWIQNLYENAPITVRQLDIFILSTVAIVLILIILSLTGIL